jgi:hypothetical protein
MVLVVDLAMKCPKCLKEGKRSQVTQGISFTTLLHIPVIWDEDGKLIPDSNRTETTTRYSCSEGHEWHE